MLPRETRPTLNLELRLKDGAHRCEGRVEVKHQGEWGTVDHGYWRVKDASVVCRQLECGAAIGFPGRAYFGPGLGPIWLLHTSCEGTESTVSDCRHSDIRDYRNDSYSHDRDAGVVCSGKSCLIWQGSSSRKSLCLITRMTQDYGL
ncbi:hypothetical protein FD755_025243 [Muntiacus reevesi]|uniref:SRCR domain-containing protein n=1 Tax=Muntiacus reevesi TaxID=9886 RepID=A0A5N3UP36_MUNRE|nr:hypothetical protein FD755_025243 [Muntiacus reevesi]